MPNYIIKTKAWQPEYPAFSDIPVAADTGDHVFLKASDAPVCVFVETTGA